MTQASTMISAAQGYASTMLDAATSTLEAAADAVEWAGAPTVGFAYANLPTPPAAALKLDLPNIPNVALNLPNAPSAAPPLKAVSAPDTGNMPVFSETAPEFVMPDRPQTATAFNVAAPTIATNFVFPAAPAQITSPKFNEVVFSEKTVPAAPEIVKPKDLADAPAFTSIQPTNLDSAFTRAFDSQRTSATGIVKTYVDEMMKKTYPGYDSMMAAMSKKLDALLTGDAPSGFSKGVEDAIYARARSKNSAEARRVRDQAVADAATRGFTMPTGALASALQQARQGGADNNAMAAREIVVLQAEMEQKNVQFAITTAGTMYGVMMDATDKWFRAMAEMNGQAIGAAKAIMESTIEAYNIAVKAYGVKVDVWKTDYLMYENQIKLIMNKIEVYKGQIGVLQLEYSTDQMQVERLKAQVSSLTALGEVYKTQVAAVASQASMERTKLDLFQAQVQGYAALVQAKNSEWQGYSAAIAGESAKAGLYNAQVGGYVAQVQGYKAQVEAKVAGVQAAVATNESISRQYLATVSGYEAAVRATGLVANTQLQNNAQVVSAFSAKATAETAKAQVASEYYRATANVSIENAKLAMQSLVADAQAKTNYTHLLATLHTANATVHANLAGSAMAGMNSLAIESATPG